MTRICDLPPELVGLIFTKIPITSIRTVRSTCTMWKALTKYWGLGIGAAREQFLGLMAMDSKVCSLRFHLRRKNNSKEDGDFLELSIKQVDLLKGVDIAKIFYCDGLSLCVAKDNSRLMVWNPYLGQTRWIEPRTKFHTLDTYALGYDINRNHKILKFMDSRPFEDKDFFGYELYDFISHSWRVLDVTSNWHIQDYQRGVSLKGNSYFYAQEKLGHYVAPPRGYKIARQVITDLTMSRQLSLISLCPTLRCSTKRKSYAIGKNKQHKLYFVNNMSKKIVFFPNLITNYTKS
ncbi:PREDICTED: F-box/kelch-repeat protein At1g24800-like [Camelina sativa]|uniref:F-box/kelch-repeat protein At1g24800-like n=1 Tax=Camelina sativa TaxID=90675 RepID=A0ABM0UTJ3_CAMSA|nr:PREDICTED: F-box/kelch-repeat protein At1g24800-like [Camelina sativa]